MLYTQFNNTHPNKPNQHVNAIAWSPDSQFLVVISHDSYHTTSSVTLTVWQVETKTIAFQNSIDADQVEDVIFTSDGQWILATVYTKERSNSNMQFGLVVIDAKTGDISSHVQSETYLSYLTLLPIDRSVLVASDASNIVRFDRETLTFLPMISLHDDITAISIDPTFQWIAVATEACDVHFWDVDFQTKIVAYNDFEDIIFHLEWMPDSSAVISSGWDHTIKVLPKDKKQSLTSINRHQHWVMMTSLAPHAKYLASVSKDMTIKIWDAQSFEELITVQNEKESSKFLDICKWSPNGKWLATASHQNSVYIWDVSTMEVPE